MADAYALKTSTDSPVRLEWEGTGIYVHPDGPDWFVPNPRGDFILSRLLDGEAPGDIAAQLARLDGLEDEPARRQVLGFLERSKVATAEAYPGRSGLLRLKELRECWLHLTNRCNAACGHCMFSCRPEPAEEIDTARARSVVDQALSLGARVFYFTGGEPTLHPGFGELTRRVLALPDTRLVVLTNALRAREVVGWADGWPTDRVHFQVSVDGSEESHDALRSPGAYQRMIRDVQILREAGFAVNLAMTVHRENLQDMPSVVELAGRLGLGGVHYLWLFGRGQADQELMAGPEDIWPALRDAARCAESSGVRIDNIETLRRQVFSLPGTRFDLSNAGWESLAVGPDGQVYPSPSLVLDSRVRCGHVREGLEKIWRTSGVLGKLRAASLIDSQVCLESPLRFLIGGGDVDHSFLHGGELVGHDPYGPLYRRIALWLIAREAERFDTPPGPHMRLAMGDYLHECPEGGGALMFTHSNCVLSLAGGDGHDLVGEFYSAAARAVQEDILNPAEYDAGEMDFLPAGLRGGSYGCGSPVADADLRPGQTVVDLGCGAGMEVFLAARALGPKGRAIGIDMLEPMLSRARSGAEEVARTLGFSNMEFHRALLEELPLADASVDVVISNCVINLCPHKRRAFSEIFRVLRPGGKLVISDVTSQTDIPLEVQYDQKMRGECLGGAFRIDRLFDLLGDVGFAQAVILKRFPYRQVQGHPFYSLTYSALRPTNQMQAVMYRGPFAGVVTEDGRLVRRGRIVSMPWQGDVPMGDAVLVLDEHGRVTNIAQEMSCCTPAGLDADSKVASCCSEPGPETIDTQDSSGCCDTQDAKGPKARGEGKDSLPHQAGCMVCGAALEYRTLARPEACHYCGLTKEANALCREGHFVCDACHSQDALERISHLLIRSEQTDMIALLESVRREASLSIHGPEHHALVPGIMVAAYRNAGGRAGRKEILQAIRRGATVVGGACGFLGACGAAIGIGAGFSILLGTTPLDGPGRQSVQQAVAEALADIAALEAGRCCQREGWIALRRASRLSRELLDIPLEAEAPLACSQQGSNAQCIGPSCPLWPGGAAG